MINAVIFDLDNTLIDFVERKRRTIKEAVKAMIEAGLPGPFDKLHKDFSDFYWREGIEDQRIFQKYLNKRFGRVDYVVLAHAIIAYRKVNSSLLEPYPGAEKMLQSLKKKGLKLAILSDAPRLEAYLRLCGVGFEKYFDVILTKDDVRVLKPAKKGFIMVAETLKVSLPECAMVGDRPEKDILGAKSLGMTTIFAKYGNHDFTEGDADFTAEKVEDIVNIVEKIN